MGRRGDAISAKLHIWKALCWLRHSHQLTGMALCVFWLQLYSPFHSTWLSKLKDVGSLWPIGYYTDTCAPFGIGFNCTLASNASLGLQWESDQDSHPAFFLTFCEVAVAWGPLYAHSFYAIARCAHRVKKGSRGVRLHLSEYPAMNNWNDLPEISQLG